MDPVSPSKRVHVHVPYIKFRDYAGFLRQNRLGVELYIGSFFIDSITLPDIEELASSIDWGPTISLHGPFMDLSPGAVDQKVAAVSLERYLQVISFAKVLKPEVVVFHSGYDKWKYAGNVKIWLDNSLKTWRAVMAEAEKLGVKVAIENIVDEEPSHLSLLAERMGHPLFGLCLDVGHREIFSTLPPEDWVSAMHPYIFELHLHDNMGTADDHMPVGTGRVGFPALFKRLGELSADPVYTLEAHSPEDALESVRNLRRLLK